MKTKQIYAACISSLKKLAPWLQLKNPVMFLVYLGAILSTGFLLRDFSGFNLQVVLWLWFTVLFANFAEALAEGRGKAQADSLKKMRTTIMAKKRLEGEKVVTVHAAELKNGDIVICQAGDIIPTDGEVIEGIASVDESAITGESAPVIRESGGDRSAVTGGTRVLSDCIVVRITAEQGHAFIDRMIHMVESAERQRTPNEIALEILLISLSAVFVLAVFTLPAFVHYSSENTTVSGLTLLTFPVLVALLVCLIPTTIGGLLSAIGISGMNRLISRNVIAMSGRAIEAAGDIDVLLLDKTGTITIGNRMATEFYPVAGITEQQLAEAAQLASLADETPEGRSIVVLAKNKFALRPKEIRREHIQFITFSAETRMSGVDLLKEDKSLDRSIRKGAFNAIEKFIQAQGGQVPPTLREAAEKIAKDGGTPLAVAEGKQVLGMVALKDVVKGGIRERFAHLRAMGIRTIMVTGDNPLTAAAIAAEAGIDDFMAEAKPEDKLRRIRAEQAEGRLVAMAGDGTNDAPALAQADVGVAMNAGTQVAREAGNMVDLDSNPTKLIEIVEVGKQLLMTRGALTTFSVANDVAKYFAILPALFGGLYAAGNVTGPLSALNIMRLASPQSAILSALIFNALIIVLLIPLALRGVSYRTGSAATILQRNLLVYGLGGLVVPFIGIKLIDFVLVMLHLV